MRAAIDADYANRLILAEANQWPADVRPYFGDGDECHMAFHFPLMPRIYMALRQEDRLPITDIMAQTPPIPDNCQWGLFLRNHDELTLEMVTDDERDYMYFAYSADPRMRINVGIRRRLAPLVDNNRRRIELLNSLLLSFPGTPILYYGDEIGMGDNIYLGDRNGVRTPMQWTSDRNAGFSKCDPARLYFPVVMDPIYGYQVVNVEAQLSDQSSLLHWTRNMIALRKLFQVFGRGTLTFLNPANRKILAYLRDLDRGDGSHETVLCVANLSRFAQPVVARPGRRSRAWSRWRCWATSRFPPSPEQPYSLSLAPYSFHLARTPARQREAGGSAGTGARKLARRELAGRVRRARSAHQGLGGFRRRSRAGPARNRPAGLASPAALVRRQDPQNPIGARHRLGRASRCRCRQHHRCRPAAICPPASSIPPALFYFEIAYGDNPCDIYQVPLAFSAGADAEELAPITRRASSPCSLRPPAPASCTTPRFAKIFARACSRSSSATPRSLSPPPGCRAGGRGFLAAAAGGRAANDDDCGRRSRRNAPAPLTKSFRPRNELRPCRAGHRMAARLAARAAARRRTAATRPPIPSRA